MAIGERVKAVLAAWCGMDPADSNNIDLTTKLEDLWISTENSTIVPHSGVPFAAVVNRLHKMLNDEFQKPGTERIKTSDLETASFSTSDMNTVGLLVKGVAQCEPLASTAVGGPI
jgi:hypothetical protein